MTERSARFQRRRPDPDPPLSARRAARRHPLMVTREVAELFRVTPTTVIRWAEKGRITCSRTIGGHRRFQRAEIEELAKSAGIVLPPPSTGTWPRS